MESAQSRTIKSLKKLSQRQTGYQLQARLDRKDITKNTADIEALAEGQIALIQAAKAQYLDIILIKWSILGLLLTTILLGAYVILK
jgi:hypothetical protein